MQHDYAPTPLLLALSQPFPLLAGTLDEDGGDMLRGDDTAV